MQIAKCTFAQIVADALDTRRAPDTRIRFSRGTDYCLNTLKTLQAIVMERFKLVRVSRRDALITSCKRDDVLCIQVRLRRLGLKCRQKRHLNPTDDHKVCNYIAEIARMLMHCHRSTADSRLLQPSVSPKLHFFFFCRGKAARDFCTRDSVVPGTLPRAVYHGRRPTKTK